MCVVGYGPHGAYRCLDLNLLQTKGKVSITTTRDIRVLKNVYSAKDMKFKDKQHFSVTGTQGDATKCLACGKSEITEFMIPECEACRTGKGNHEKNQKRLNNW